MTLSPNDFRIAPVPITEEIIDVHTTMRAKRKLAIVPRSKKSSPQDFPVGDMVYIWIQLSNEKREKWRSRRAALSF